MLTIFSTPKPFRGHSGIIQRNALQSWKRMGPEVEVILFGDEEGSAEAARDIAIRHEPNAHLTPTGAKSLPGIFGDAGRIASNGILCYVNCDIILPRVFLDAVKQAASLRKPFLMVGQRWDTDITEPLDFSQSDWEEQVSRLARQRGKPAGPWFVDYFVFRRGFFRELPPLVIGRWAWDSWLIWKARNTPGAIVLDATACVTAVHQNHDYGYHPLGLEGVRRDEDGLRNLEIAGNGARARNLEVSTHRLTPEGIERVWSQAPLILQMRAAGGQIRRANWRKVFWFPLLGITRPLRRRLGLDSSRLKRIKTRSAE